MISKFFEKRKIKKIDGMIAELAELPEQELKMWYSCSETGRLLGHSDSHDNRLNQAIEEELMNRGLEHMTDY